MGLGGTTVFRDRGVCVWEVASVCKSKMERERSERAQVWAWKEGDGITHWLL